MCNGILLFLVYGTNKSMKFSVVKDMLFNRQRSKIRVIFIYRFP